MSASGELRGEVALEGFPGQFRHGLPLLGGDLLGLHSHVSGEAERDPQGECTSPPLTSAVGPLTGRTARRSEDTPTIEDTMLSGSRSKEAVRD